MVLWKHTGLSPQEVVDLNLGPTPSGEVGSCLAMPGGIQNLHQLAKTMHSFNSSTTHSDTIQSSQ